MIPDADGMNTTVTARHTMAHSSQEAVNITRAYLVSVASANVVNKYCWVSVLFLFLFGASCR
jgi:hypothetical protein